MSKLTIDDANVILQQNFAGWVQDLDITFEHIGDGTATLRVPSSPRLNRTGGTVCGQAIMTIADTAMIFAVCSQLGRERPVTTVNQTTSFLRPAADADLMAEAKVIKPGRTIVYGEVTLHTGNREKPIAHATSTVMVLPSAGDAAQSNE
jgi:uncharacterized protein (TIGR00369 family)